MNGTLGEMVADACRGRTAFLGVGSVDREDDGAGVRCAEHLARAGIGNVFIGAATPERCVPSIRDGGFDSVVLLDAVDTGAEPGSVVMCDAQEIEHRFPAVSTHKLPLSLLARLLSDGNGSRVNLIGIEAGSVIENRSEMTQRVRETVESLAGCIEDRMLSNSSVVQEQLCR